MVLDCIFLSYHVRFQSKSTLIICLNVKQLLARNKRDIWILSDCNGAQTHNHLVRKRTFNSLANLGKWLSCVTISYLYDAFDCILVSCHIHVSEWIQTHYLPECQVALCLKRTRYMKFKWLERDLNLQPYSL